jgi:hypothetical protein
MKNTNIFFPLLLFSASNSLGQITFQKTIGGISNEGGSTIVEAHDGGYVVSGNTSSYGAGSADIYLVKIDSLGNVIWTKTFGGASSEYLPTMIKTSDSCYMITTTTRSFGSNNVEKMYVLKTDISGNILWSRSFVNDDSTRATYGNGIIETPGGFIAVGSDHKARSVFLIKADNNGDTVQVKRIGNRDSILYRSYGGGKIIQALNGNYVIAGGYYQTTSALSLGLCLKIDSNLNVNWFKTYSTSIGGHYTIYDIVPTGDSGYISVGDAGTWNMVLSKMDGMGTVQWTKTFGVEGRINSIVQTSDGGYAFVAYRRGGNGNCLLIKINSNGDTLWSRRYFGGDLIGAYSDVRQTIDGGFIISTSTLRSGAGRSDILLIKTDSLGHSDPCIEYPDTIIPASITSNGNERYYESYDSCRVISPSTTSGSGGVRMDVCYCDTSTASISLDNDSVFCVGDSVILSTDTGNYTYLWSNGLMTQSITVTSSGNYAVLLIDSGGCWVRSDTVRITVDSLSVSFSGLPDTVCLNGGSVTLSGNPIGGIFTGPGMTDSTFNPVSAGVGFHQIIYSYTDSIGCNASDNMNVVVDICANVLNYYLGKSLRFYPNPTAGYITLEASSDNPIQSVAVYSYDSRLLNTIINNQSSIFNADLQGLAAGIYFLDCKTESGREKIKVVKY